MRGIIWLLSLAALCALSQSGAQLEAPNEAGVSLGHFHTIVRDVEAAGCMLAGSREGKMEILVDIRDIPVLNQ